MVYNLGVFRSNEIAEEELNRWGKDYFDQVYTHCTKDATDGAMTLVDAWWNGACLDTYREDPHYEEAYRVTMQMISLGCG